MIIKTLVLAFAVFVVLSPEGIAQPVVETPSPEGAQVETQADEWNQYWGYCTYSARMFRNGEIQNDLDDLPTLPFKIFQRPGGRSGRQVALRNHFRTAVRSYTRQYHDGVRTIYVGKHNCHVYSYGTSGYRAAMQEYEALYESQELHISRMNLQFPPECSPVMMTDDMLMGTQCDWFEAIR